MGLVQNIKDNDYVSIRQAIAKLGSTKLGPTSSPAYAGLTLTGLTASRLIASNASKELISTSLNSWLSGTANQITVTDDGDGTATLSTPQNIHTEATPEFSGITLSGLTVGSVLFAGSGGTITEDNTNFFWNNSNKRLGLKDNTPETTLDVAGEIRGQRLLIGGVKP